MNPFQSNLMTSSSSSTYNLANTQDLLSSNENAGAGFYMLTPLQISLLLNSYASASPSSSSNTEATTTSASSIWPSLSTSQPTGLTASLFNNTNFINNDPYRTLGHQLIPNQALIDAMALQLSQKLIDNRPAASSSVSSLSPPLRQPLQTTQPVWSSSSSSLFANGRSGERTKLFVGNLPDGTALVELFELFKPYGHINHQLCVVKEGNYAFIHFFSERAAEKALNAVNGVWFRNRYLRVEYSVSNGHLPKKFDRSKLNFII